MAKQDKENLDDLINREDYNKIATETGPNGSMIITLCTQGQEFGGRSLRRFALIYLETCSNSNQGSNQSYLFSRGKILLMMF